MQMSDTCPRPITLSNILRMAQILLDFKLYSLGLLNTPANYFSSKMLCNILNRQGSVTQISKLIKEILCKNKLEVLDFFSSSSVTFTNIFSFFHPPLFNTILYAFYVSLKSYRGSLTISTMARILNSVANQGEREREQEGSFACVRRHKM